MFLVFHWDLCPKSSQNLYESFSERSFVDHHFRQNTVICVPCQPLGAFLQSFIVHHLYWWSTNTQPSMRCHLIRFLVLVMGYFSSLLYWDSCLESSQNPYESFNGRSFVDYHFWQNFIIYVPCWPLGAFHQSFIVLHPYLWSINTAPSMRCHLIWLLELVMGYFSSSKSLLPSSTRSWWATRADLIMLSCPNY